MRSNVLILYSGGVRPGGSERENSVSKARIGAT